MKKKLLLGAILAVFMLVAISYGSAMTISSQKSKPAEKKESPLFKIRTELTIRNEIEKLKASYLSDRIFILPFVDISVSKNKRFIPSWSEPTCLANPCFKTSRCLDISDSNIDRRQ